MHSSSVHTVIATPTGSYSRLSNARFATTSPFLLLSTSPFVFFCLFGSLSTSHEKSVVRTKAPSLQSNGEGQWPISQPRMISSHVQAYLGEFTMCNALDIAGAEQLVALCMSFSPLCGLGQVAHGRLPPAKTQTSSPTSECGGTTPRQPFDVQHSLL